MLPVALLVVLITTWMSVPASGATCPPIPHLQNGYYTTSDSSFTTGGTATAYCFPGYDRNRPLTITCNGTWPSGASLPTCTSTTCSAAPPIANGYLTYNSISFTDGGSATATCFPGYQLNGRADITCTIGQWPSNASLPTCTPTTCSAAPTIANGYLTFNSRSFTDGGSATATCFPGYQLKGYAAISCGSGKWPINGSLPTCTPLSTCPPLTVDNGDVSSGSGNLTNIHSVKCSSGFELRGNSIVICLDDGSWSSIPECVQSVECSSLTVANGQVSQGQNTVGSVRILSCDDDYEPKSDRTIVCLVNGSWSSNPTCQEIYASAPSSAPSTAGPIAEAHQPSTMLAAGAVGLGIGSVAMAIPFIIVLLCIRRSMAYNGKKQHPTTAPKEIINMTSNTAYGDVMISNPESVYEQINA